ncbi:hypothetical protein LC612_32510 [Nostoc sp. CHAB 5834]|nr:hypothetical protein [Nostoc sp. CHAB 5834]
MENLLLVIDGLSIIRRVYEANQAPDSPEKAERAMVSAYASLQRAVREHEPTHLALAMDAGGRTWRHDIYPKYKIDRKPMPDCLRQALPVLTASVRNIGWTVLTEPGVEADDTVGSIADAADLEGIPTVVLSGDKDLVQLLRLNARVYDHFGSEWRDHAWCLKKFGVSPELVPDWQALHGDPVDGIPGVDGVGRVTATKLLLEYGSLEKVLEAAPGIKGVVGKRLVEQADRARISRRLTNLKYDVFPEGIDFDDFLLHK